MNVPTETGTYIDPWFGQYTAPRAILTLLDWGWEPFDEEILRKDAVRWLSAMGPNGTEGLPMDDEDHLLFSLTEGEDWATNQVPEGLHVGSDPYGGGGWGIWLLEDYRQCKGCETVEHEDGQRWPSGYCRKCDPPPTYPVIRIEHDPHPMDPREWDHIGTMSCNHRRYDLGDEETPDEWMNVYALEGFSGLANRIRRERGARVVLPLGLLDHSGISMYVGDGAHPHDYGGWDSGLVGVIFDTPESREMMGIEDWGHEDIEEALEQEVDEYDSYLRGLVYMYALDETEDGPVLDGVSGFYDRDYCEQEAEAHAKYLYEQAMRSWDPDWEPTD